MRNKEIKEYIKSRNVPMWRVAERLGIADSSFSRMLRYEISEEKKFRIKAIADELGQGRDEVLSLAQRALCLAEGERLVENLAVQGMPHHRAVQRRELLLEGELGGAGQILGAHGAVVDGRLLGIGGLVEASGNCQRLGFKSNISHSMRASNDAPLPSLCDSPHRAAPQPPQSRGTLPRGGPHHGPHYRRRSPGKATRRLSEIAEFAVKFLTQHG